MTKHLTLILFIGLAWGQNTTEIESNFDRMVSKGGTIYLGEFSRIEKNTIYFKTFFTYKSIDVVNQNKLI